LGEGAKAVQACGPVSLESGGAEELGELAGAPSSQEIHLEETLLSVDEAKGLRHIASIASTDGGNPEGVAFDGDGGRKPGYLDLAFELGQAARDRPSHEKACCESEEEHSDYNDPDDLDPTTHADLLRGENTVTDQDIAGLNRKGAKGAKKSQF
jgi:hypothetical protein